jgi:hypothetical protein
MGYHPNKYSQVEISTIFARLLPLVPFLSSPHQIQLGLPH